MSARQAFIPQAPARAPPSDSHPHTADAHARDGERDSLINGNGKPRSIAAFLGQKRGTAADTSQPGSGPTKGPGLARSNSSTNRRSFDGIMRPEITPMSIIPYPGTGSKQTGAGQTPRAVGPGPFEFPRPMTPVSIPRVLKKGLGAFVDVQEEEISSSGNSHLPGPGGETNMHVSGGYMRVFEEFDDDGGAVGVNPSLGHNIAAPKPGHGLARHVGNVGEECEVDGRFTRSLRSLDAMHEKEVGIERMNNPQKSLGGTKRTIYAEDSGGNMENVNDDLQVQGPAKRMRQVPQDQDEYFPISSPHIPQTPGPPIVSTKGLDPSLVAGSLFDNFEEFISLEEIEVDWKRWMDCSGEEWLKGFDEITKEFTDLLSMAKDNMAEKVMAYKKMFSSVEEKRAEVNRNIEVIQGKGIIVQENISKLGTK